MEGRSPWLSIHSHVLRVPDMGREKMYLCFRVVFHMKYLDSSVQHCSELLPIHLIQSFTISGPRIMTVVPVVFSVSDTDFLHRAVTIVVSFLEEAIAGPVHRSLECRFSISKNPGSSHIDRLSVYGINPVKWRQRFRRICMLIVLPRRHVKIFARSFRSFPRCNRPPRQCLSRRLPQRWRYTASNVDEGGQSPLASTHHDE